MAAVLEAARKLKALYGDEAWARLSAEQRERALETLQQMDEAMGSGAQPTEQMDDAGKQRREAAAVAALVAADGDSADEGVPPPQLAKPKAKKKKKKKKKQQKKKRAGSARRVSRPPAVSARDHAADVQFEELKRQQLQEDIDAVRQKLRSLSYGLSGQDPARLFRIFHPYRSGAINLREFRNALRKDGGVTRHAMSDEAIEALFHEVDVDGSGEVDMAEMTSFVWPDNGDKLVQSFMSSCGDLSAIHTINPDRSLGGGVKAVQAPRVAQPKMYTGAARHAHAEHARARTPGRAAGGRGGGRGVP
eukprot:COSAG06_NODE_2699_length_6433_cov_82.794601_1_plen_305_part_00